MPAPTEPARHGPLDGGRTALLDIDVQRGVLGPAAAARPTFHTAAREVVVPNIRRLADAVRAAGGEVVYTVIESLTRDGRDRSLDYKQTGYHFPPGSDDARVIDEVAPGPDDIVLPKTSSSPFNSTVLAYVLRNMGIDTVIAVGFLTDQCVDHTVRDGADLGFRMICVDDACATDTDERHQAALVAFAGYCRRTTTAALVAELAGA